MHVFDVKSSGTHHVDIIDTIKLHATMTLKTKNLISMISEKGSNQKLIGTLDKILQH